MLFNTPTIHLNEASVQAAERKISEAPIYVFDGNVELGDSFVVQGKSVGLVRKLAGLRFRLRVTHNIEQYKPYNVDRHLRQLATAEAARRGMAKQCDAIINVHFSYKEREKGADTIVYILDVTAEGVACVVRNIA